MNIVPYSVLKAKKHRINQKYLIKLTAEERHQLEQWLSSGIVPTRSISHARIPLKSDSSEQGANWSYSQICEALDIAPLTVANVQKRFAEEVLSAALIARNLSGNMSVDWMEKQYLI